MSKAEPSTPPPPSRAQAIAMTLVGVDWGARRIGLALKPAGQDWALPLAVLVVRDERQAIEELGQMLECRGAEGIVVGLPLHADPSQALEVRRFARRARTAAGPGRRWFFIDESLTSYQAESVEQAGSRQRRSDDLAAALILETFIEQCR